MRKQTNLLQEWFEESFIKNTTVFVEYDGYETKATISCNMQKLKKTIDDDAVKLPVDVVFEYFAEHDVPPDTLFEDDYQHVIIGFNRAPDELCASLEISDE